MRATTTSVLPAPLERVWELMQLSSTLVYVTKGKVTFSNADKWPEKWQVNELIQTWVQPVKGEKFYYEFTFIDIDPVDHSMSTIETGGDVEEWIHWMKVEQIDDKTCRYIDVVDFKTQNPWMTIPAWIWIKRYYRYRHDRWLNCFVKIHNRRHLAVKTARFLF